MPDRELRIEDRGSRIARPLLSSLLLLALVSPSFAQQFWYDVYEEGEKACKAGNWAVCEAKMKEALKGQPNSSSRMRAYGTRFIAPYIPDYWLAVAVSNQGRYQEALDRFQRVNKGALGKTELSEVNRLMAQATEQLKPKVEPKPEVPPGPTPEELRAKQIQQEVQALAQRAKNLIDQGQVDEARKVLNSIREKDPTNKLISDLSNQITARENELRAKVDEDKKKLVEEKKQQFTGLMQQASQALTSKNYAQARNLAKQADTLGVDPQKSKDLLRAIDDKEKVAKNVDALRASVNKSDWQEAQKLAQQIASLDPQNADLKGFQAQIEKGLATLKTDDLEQGALLAFYSGDYDHSAGLLQRVVKEKKDSAKVYFYLGCSFAAQALLKGKQGQPLLQQAKTQFAQARKIDPQLKFDERFISPRIVKIYRQAQ